MASKTNKKAEQKQKMVRIVAVVACAALLLTAIREHPALCRFQPPALSKDKNTPLPPVRRRRFLYLIIMPQACLCCKAA